MNTKDLILKCYAERQGQQWIAVCLDFDLAAQADTLEESKEKLHAMIGEYVHDALAGEDQAYAGQLLYRRAPRHLYLKWHLFRCLSNMRRVADGLRNRFALFTETMPMRPV
jgi:hypothetical protein